MRERTDLSRNGTATHIPYNSQTGSARRWIGRWFQQEGPSGSAAVVAIEFPGFQANLTYMADLGIDRPPAICL